MITFLKLMARLLDFIHEVFIKISEQTGLNLTDKQLHFWLVGIAGITVFLIADLIFHKLAEWNISVISLVYTLTVLLVLVFGLEIEQKITGSGVMEFKDIVSGIWGFIVIFTFYLCIRIPYSIISKKIMKK